LDRQTLNFRVDTRHLALAIARELELSDSADQIVTGPLLKQAAGSGDMDQLTRQARVFTRVEPRQKLDIVESPRIDLFRADSICC